MKKLLKYYRENRWRIIVSALCAFAVVTAIVSLRWRICHDSPLLLYIALMMDKYNFVPYRDIFDMNMPGTYFINYLIVHFLGIGDIAFRFSDLLWLAGLSGVTYYWMRVFGKLTAVGGIALFALLYFSHGMMMSMQREYLALLPVSLAIAVAVRGKKLPKAVGPLIIGGLFGCAVLIKPQFIIGIIPVIWYQVQKYLEPGNHRVVSLIRLSAISLLGMVVPLSIAIIYLTRNDALLPFLDIAGNYWHLYSQLDFENRLLEGSDRIIYLLKAFRLGLLHRAIWMLPVIAGLLVRFGEKKLKLSAERKLLFELTAVFTFYPLISGQFWDYHWLPFLFFIVLSGSIIIMDQSKTAGRINSILFAVFLSTSVIYFLILPIDVRSEILSYPEKLPVKHNRPEKIAEFLEANSRAGDTVQPLDWTGGAVHGMLIAEARLATSFIYDFHFYHHVDNVYLQNLRRRFIDELNKEKPKFIVEIVKDKPWVRGKNTTKTFRELENLLAEFYFIVTAGDGYIIYQSNKQK